MTAQPRGEGLGTMWVRFNVKRKRGTDERDRRKNQDAKSSLMWEEKKTANTNEKRCSEEPR